MTAEGKDRQASQATEHDCVLCTSLSVASTAAGFHAAQPCGDGVTATTVVVVVAAQPAMCAARQHSGWHECLGPC